MITVVTVYFEKLITGVPALSRCFDTSWVDKLYRGIKRHYQGPFRFVCLTDGSYSFQEPIEQRPLLPSSWLNVCQQGYGVDAERIAFMGLDTVITGDLGPLFDYRGNLAVPEDPYRKGRACSGFVLCPSRPDIARVEAKNCMGALDDFPHDWLHELYPGMVESYKGSVQKNGLNGARVVYFHGKPKPHEMTDSWVKENWV